MGAFDAANSEDDSEDEDGGAARGGAKHKKVRVGVRAYIYLP